MSTSEARRGRALATCRRGARTQGFRYDATRNFPGRRSFSARHTMTGFDIAMLDSNTRIDTRIDTRIYAGLGREKPACQY
jgi:hypothetical protein